MISSGKRKKPPIYVKRDINIKGKKDKIIVKMSEKVISSHTIDYLRNI